MLKFFSGRLLVSPFSLVLLLIMSLSPDAPFLFIALFFALLHELGHLFAMKILKIVKVTIDFAIHWDYNGARFICYLFIVYRQIANLFEIAGRGS